MELNQLSLNLLMQIPLAGVVVLVVIVFLNHISKYNTIMMTFLEAQQKINQEFISDQRDQSNEAIGRLAEEIKTVGQIVASMNGVLQAHDAASKERAVKK